MHPFKSNRFDRFGWNLQFSNKEASYPFFDIFVRFFFDIEDSYVLSPCVGFQFDVSRLQHFDVCIKRFNILAVIFNCR